MFTESNLAGARASTSNSCVVSGTETVDFGETSLRTSADAVGKISARCSLGTEFTVSLGGGGEGSILARKMRTGQDTIPYQLYLDPARTQIFGDGTQGSRFQGDGQNGVDVDIPVYGRADLGSGPQPGDYSDRVVITVEY